MKSPSTGGETILVQEWAQHKFRKEIFEVWNHYYVCKDTGDDFTTTELDELNVQQVYNLYRVKHHIPFPEEITAVRERYGLSAAKMAEVLDLGINIYRQYEQGTMPSLANSKLIRLASDPANFLGLLKEKEAIFSPKAFAKIHQKVESLQEENQLDSVVAYLWNFHMEANEFTGFVRPSFEKVANFVLFFIEKAKPLKTRLNKLLFYGDFVNFKRTGFAISGCNYRAIPFGPVPAHFHELFGILETEEYIRIEEEMSERGNVGERFVAAKPFDPTLFSERELENMQRVVDQFSELRTRQIIELSHQEKGWLENQEKRELINYQQFAFHLKGV